MIQGTISGGILHEISLNTSGLIPGRFFMQFLEENLEEFMKKLLCKS